MVLLKSKTESNCCPALSYLHVHSTHDAFNAEVIQSHGHGRPDQHLQYVRVYATARRASVIIIPYNNIYLCNYL